MGLGYWWSLDFAGPLPVTSRHNRYTLVMVEHFSKWIELVALPELPTAIRRKVSGVVQFDNPDVWIQVCAERAELFQRVMPMAFQNLAIAQHRDTLRYATI
jgi:hypothetical protein